MSKDLETAILAAEQQRCAALLANDAAALEGLLDDRLAFCHATGHPDDKAAFLAGLASGRVVYLGIEWQETRVVELAPGVAMVTGRMLPHVTVDGVEKRLDNRAIAIWALHGAAWRLTAFQSTPIKM